MPWRIGLVAACLSALMVTGCPGGTSIMDGPPDPWDPPNQSDVVETLRDCSGGEVCVVVELGCCDHCNGGAVIAVVDGQQDVAREDYGEVCDGTTACTEVACADAVASCVAGLCELVGDDGGA